MGEADRNYAALRPGGLPKALGLTETMLQLASPNFAVVLDLEVPWAHAYADMRPGKTDRERRENYRAAAKGRLVLPPEPPLWWAFKITVGKCGRPLDVDNIAKTIIDSFSGSQLRRDASPHGELELYPDDSFFHVRALQVMGRPAPTDSTRIEVFACIRE